MLLNFFDTTRIIHYEFVPTGNQPSLLFGSNGKDAWKSSTKTNNSRILHHDNAPARTALSVREPLALKYISVLEQPACSPKLVSNEFFLFPMLEEILKGMHYDEIDYIKGNTTAAL